MKEDADRTDPLLWALRPHLDDAQAETFSLALKDQWAKSGGKAKDKWAVFQQAVFCSEQRLHTIAPRLEEVTEAGQHHLAGWYLSVCARHGSQAGRDWVGYWVDNATKDGLLTKAVARLEEIAQREGKTVAEVKAGLNPHVHDEVAEAQVPTLGFDAHGQLELSYGPRQITVRLTAAGDLSTESEGKVSSSLPRAKKDDDPAAVNAAKERFKAAKKELAVVTKQIKTRLERAMIVGRDWRHERFVALFLEHPLISQIGTGLVFAHGEQLFRVSEERELIDVDGEPVVLPQTATIRLAHPLEIDAARRRAWLAHIEDASVVQPFDQLSRPLFEGVDDETLPKETLAPSTFVRRCRDAGWLRGSPQDAGMVYDEWFKLPARGVVVGLSHSGYAVSDLSWGDEIEIQSLSFTSLGGEHLRPGDVDPIAFSEARLAVQRIVS